MKENLFAFMKEIPSLVIDLLGYPNIQVHSDSIELYFETFNVIKSLSLLEMIKSDDFRVFASSDGKLVVVYTFYLD